MSMTSPESVEAAREQDLLRGRPYDMIRALRSAMSELWSDKAGLLGLSVILIIVFSAIFAPWLAPHDPNEQSLLNRLTPPFQTWDYPLGTDGLGKDELSLLLYGARTSLIVTPADLVFIAGTSDRPRSSPGIAAGSTTEVVMRAVRRTGRLPRAAPGADHPRGRLAQPHVPDRRAGPERLDGVRADHSRNRAANEGDAVRGGGRDRRVQVPPHGLQAHSPEPNVSAPDAGSARVRPDRLAERRLRS